MSQFKTSLPAIEMSKRLVVNVEKEFADRRYDIKIYEVVIKAAGKDEKKYQYEMFAVNEP